MFPAFLALYAGGCFVAVALLKIRLTDWRYVRLMAIVSTAIALLALLFQIIETSEVAKLSTSPALLLMSTGLLGGVAWLFINAAQGQQLGRAQKFLPAFAGLACLGAAVLSSPPILDRPSVPKPPVRSISGTVIPERKVALWSAVGTTLLGGLLLGLSTTAMLLGHRYLTDTGMSIEPLRHITQAYLIAIGVRVAWSILMSLPLWSADALPSVHAIYFWLALSVRFAIGLLVAGIFAWMIGDCVRRRATQSATALYYLSMLFILSGELSARYLLHEEQLAL